MQHTIEPLLIQLINDGWPAAQILVGVGNGGGGGGGGDHGQQQSGPYAQIVHRYLSHDMMDFNGLWAAVIRDEEDPVGEEEGLALMKETEWLFLMHDTIEVRALLWWAPLYISFLMAN